MLQNWDLDGFSHTTNLLKNLVFNNVYSNHFLFHTKLFKTSQIASNFHCIKSFVVVTRVDFNICSTSSREISLNCSLRKWDTTLSRKVERWKYCSGSCESSR